MYCDNCGTFNEDNSSYCSSCGNKINLSTTVDIPKLGMSTKETFIQSQNKIPLPEVGILIAIFGCLALAEFLYFFDELSLKARVLTATLILASAISTFYCFEGNLLKALLFTQIMYLIKASDTLMAIFGLFFIDSNDFFTLTFWAIIFTGILIGIHYYLRGKVSAEFLTLAKKYKLILF